jgi:DNA-binding MarR family transcriptional regulator
MNDATPALSEADARLQMLAEFRYELRKFLCFSELRATHAGLQPQQHQLLLQIAGAPPSAVVTISYIADRLGLKHHTTVELSKRCEESGLVRRIHNAEDRRCVILQVTAAGRKVLELLSDDHARELHELAPRMIQALTRIRNAGGRMTTPPRTARTPS